MASAARLAHVLSHCQCAAPPRAGGSTGVGASLRPAGSSAHGPESGAAAAARSIQEQGYCILPSLLDPAQLVAAQDAFGRMLPTIMASDNSTVAGRSPAYTIGADAVLSCGEPALLSLLTLPLVLDTVQAASGGGAKLRGMSLTSYPSHGTEGGYIDW
eukprot:SAG22_NODE_4947_length_1123_cov_1.236098_3_plen_158_part_00